MAPDRSLVATRFRGALAISGLIARFDEKERRAALTKLLDSAQRLGAVLPANE